MKQLLVPAVGVLLFAGVSSAGVIADLTANFTPVTFPTGWQYLRNTGAIGNSANYTPLLWDAAHTIYDITGSVFPTPTPEYTFIGSGGHMHPGRGTTQGASFNDYMIAAYTLQPGQAGAVSLVNGSLSGADPNGAGGASNGWDIRIYVGNVQAGPTLVVPWSLAATTFSQALGSLNVGDTVYVALGPDNIDFFDSAVLHFQLSSISGSIPEPGTPALLGLGLVALGFSARIRRR